MIINYANGVNLKRISDVFSVMETLKKECLIFYNKCGLNTNIIDSEVSFCCQYVLENEISVNIGKEEVLNEIRNVFINNCQKRVNIAYGDNSRLPDIYFESRYELFNSFYLEEPRWDGKTFYSLCFCLVSNIAKSMKSKSIIYDIGAESKKWNTVIKQLSWEDDRNIEIGVDTHFIRNLVTIDYLAKNIFDSEYFYTLNDTDADRQIKKGCIDSEAYKNILIVKKDDIEWE